MNKQPSPIELQAQWDQGLIDNTPLRAWGEAAERSLELMNQTKPQIKRVRREIFQLARNAPSLEVMHWYMWLDECFENDEFHVSDFSTVQWRAMALSDLDGSRVNYLLSLITPVLQAYGCVDSEGKEL
jgi:hypothetical protein